MKNNLMDIFIGTLVILGIISFIMFIIYFTVLIINSAQEEKQIKQTDNERDIQRCFDNGFGYNRTWDGFIECNK